MQGLNRPKNQHGMLSGHVRIIPTPPGLQQPSAYGAGLSWWDQQDPAYI